jgi:hypothetical protein
MISILDAAEAGQSIGVGFRLRRQPARHPILQRGVVEGSDRLDHREARSLQVLIGLHRDQERWLVLRTAAGLSPRALAPEAGGVDLHDAIELPRFFALDHGLHDLGQPRLKLHRIDPHGPPCPLRMGPSSPGAVANHATRG